MKSTAKFKFEQQQFTRNNQYYAELNTGAYIDAINVLKEKDILKGIFEFPPDNDKIDNQH